MGKPRAIIFARKLLDGENGVGRPSGSPLSVLYAKFMEHEAHGESRSSRKNHERTLDLAQQMRLHEHPTPLQVKTWRDDLLNAFAPGTADMHLDHLAAMYSWAAQTLGARHCDLNPAASVPHLKKKRRPVGVRGFADIWPQVLALFDPATEVVERAFLALCRFTLCRPGEALGLQFADFAQDVDGTWWATFIRQRPNVSSWNTSGLKSGEGKTLDLHPDCAALVIPLLRRGPQVIRTGRGGGSRAVSPFLLPLRNNDLVRIRARLKVLPAFAEKGRAYRVFRASGAIELDDHGEQLSEISRALGHSNLKNTDSYMRTERGTKPRKGVLAQLGTRPGAPPGQEKTPSAVSPVEGVKPKFES